MEDHGRYGFQPPSTGGRAVHAVQFISAFYNETRFADEVGSRVSIFACQGAVEFESVTPRTPDSFQTCRGLNAPSVKRYDESRVQVEYSKVVGEAGF